jgi:AAA15 family ATPase/GTPase
VRIERFRIENFRNLGLAECNEVPDCIVICEGNGCGKSALLETLQTEINNRARGNLPG